MDLSWNNSQWISLHGDVSFAHSDHSPTHSDDSSTHSDNGKPLPQLDGLTDNRSIIMSCVVMYCKINEIVANVVENAVSGSKKVLASILSLTQPNFFWEQYCIILGETD